MLYNSNIATFDLKEILLSKNMQRIFLKKFLNESNFYFIKLKFRIEGRWRAAGKEKRPEPGLNVNFLLLELNSWTIAGQSINIIRLSFVDKFNSF